MRPCRAATQTVHLRLAALLFASIPPCCCTARCAENECCSPPLCILLPAAVHAGICYPSVKQKNFFGGGVQTCIVHKSKSKAGMMMMQSLGYYRLSESMMFKLVLLVAVLAITATALVPARFGSRTGAVRMAAEPWFPNSVTSNTVSMSTLE